MTTKAIPIEQSESEKVFRYDVVTNVLERQLKGGRWRTVNVKPDKLGYSSVGFNGRNIKLHRLIWTLVYGNIPEGMHVDHIDNNPENNKLSNLQLLSHRDNVNKSRSEINPNFHKRDGIYRVQAGVELNGKLRTFHFKNFKILADAQLFCDVYNAQFGWGKPFYSVRTKTHEYWRKYMQAFKNQYLNETGLTL